MKAPKNILKKILQEFDGEEFLLVDGFDHCIIGVTSDLRLVYNKKAMIETLTEDMTYEDALEHYYYNIEGAYVGEKTPLYIDCYL